MRVLIFQLTVLLSILCTTPICAQYDRDNLSVSGWEYAKLILDFSQGEGEFYKDTTNSKNAIRNGSKTMSDKSGNLQFIVSSCRVLDKNFEIMPGGEDYNSVGPLIKLEWCDQNSDHRGQHTFSVPVPNNDSLYYLIYYKLRIAPELSSSKSDSLFYRTIDMTKRTSLGVVNNDETLIHVDTSFNSQTTAFTRHNNGKDWWFIANTIEQKYFIYLIDSNGISLVDTTQLGTPVSKFELGGSQAVFSTGGDKFAYVNGNTDIRIFDFDQETGEFSNFRNDSSIATSERSFREGVAFSGNDRYLYVNSGGFILYQYDLINDDLKSKEVIWEYDEETDTNPAGFPLFLDQLQLGPDCKIYGAQPDGLPYFHIIHNPNARGEECGFELGYETPASSGGVTITHPHWRTATPYEDWCDTVMYTTSTQQPPALSNDHWLVYPNPVQNEIHISYTKDIVRAGSIRLYDQQGRLVLYKEAKGTSHLTNLNISELASGMYFLHIYPKGYENDANMRPVVKKIVKM